MVKIRKYANGIERFLHGEKGQRFFNFAYSIGAAIVIWGALFKILHLPGGSTLLCIGMGTEIMMFILTAFDRPPREYAWEDVFPVLDTKNAEDRPDFNHGGGGGIVINGGTGGGDLTVEGDGLNGGVINLQGGGGNGSGQFPEFAGEQMAQGEEFAQATQDYLTGMQGIAEQMKSLNETTQQLNEVSATLLASYRAITENSENISANSNGYVSQMEDLNRNIAGLNTIYEIQLKSIASQLESIDRVNRGLKDIRDMYEKSALESSHYCEETEKMARYMKQLNSVYEKMITAMTINMQGTMMGAQMGGANPFDESVNRQ